MSGPKLFGIYTAQFPFLDDPETKIRPVIVVSKPHGQRKVLTIVPISSKGLLEDVDVLSLHYWADEGLLRPSVARVHRLTTMPQSDLIAELGELTSDDKKDLQIALRQLLDL